jgi:hypothetical protein
MDHDQRVRASDAVVIVPVNFFDGYGTLANANANLAVNAGKVGHFFRGRLLSVLLNHAHKVNVTGDSTVAVALFLGGLIDLELFHRSASLIALLLQALNF